MTPLRGPPPFRAPYIHIRDTSLARACIEPPPRENSATRVFYSNFRSAYLNPAHRSFSPSLCESGCRVGCFVCLYLIRACVCTLACYTHVYVRAYRGQTLLSTSCSPSEFHPPPLSRRPTVPDLNVTVVSRATASPTRAENLPLYTRVRL